MQRAATTLIPKIEQQPKKLFEAKFLVDDPKAYQKQTLFQKPKEIGCFSYDESRNLLINNRSKLKYFCTPENGANLNTGFPDKFIERERTIEKLDSLVATLRDVNNNLSSASEKYSPDFCTWRGIITKFFITPYSRNDSWELGLTLYKGTIYIVELDKVEKESYGNYPNAKLFTYYGYKFESISTSDSPQTKVTQSELDSQDINMNVQFCSIFETKIDGRFKLVCGGEVDCLLQNNSMNSYSYAELKTNRVIENRRQESNFIKNKLLKTWAQSFIIGVKTVIFGFRDDGIYLALI